MADYLLDTNHLAFVQRAHPRVLERLRALPPGARVLTSVVGVAELLSGVHQLAAGRRQRELHALFRRVIGQMEEILPITTAVAERFAEIEASLRRRGTPIPTNDIWVAALAMDCGAVLLTNDAHFAHVAGLPVEEWSR